LSRHTAFLLLILIIGLVIRVDFLVAGGGVLDGDEAIIGLMAKHIKEGSSFPIFFYGQPYMGSIESYLAALIFGIFGVSGYGLLIVPTIISVLLIPLVYVMARSFVGRAAALFATLYVAVPPQPLIIWSIKARGGFIETVFIGAIVFLILAKAIRGERPPRPILLGFTLGVSWWINFQALYLIAISAIVYLCLTLNCRLPYYTSRVGFMLRQIALGGGAFLVGSAPFWWYNFNNNFASFGTFVAGGSSDRLGHLQGFFSEALPVLLGARREWSFDDVFPHSALLAYLLLFLILAVYLCLRVGELGALLTQRQLSKSSPLEILPLFGALVSLIFILSSYGWLSQAPRYLLPLYLSIPVLFGFAVVNMNRYFAGVFAVAALSLNVSSLYMGGRAIGGQPFVTEGERVSVSHTELNKWLLDNNVTFVRTNYWIGYRVAFETEERVRFVRFQEPGFARIPAYEVEGRAKPMLEVPYVLTPKQGEIVKRAMRLKGIAFSELSLSGYLVLFNISEPKHSIVAPLRATSISSSHSGDMLGLLDDDQIATRWASATPQNSSMFVDARFQPARKIVGLSYDYSEWQSDYPRGLNMDLFDQKGVLVKQFIPEDFEALRYFADGLPKFDLHFDEILVGEIRIWLAGSHPIFDWSIGELDLMVLNEGT
jgi:hypothetical protein